MSSSSYSDYNTKVLVPGSFSSSLGGNTYLYESKAGSKKRKTKTKVKKLRKTRRGRKTRRMC